MRICDPGRDSKTQNYEMCNPNINICYKFTRTQLHKLFSHFVSSINLTPYSIKYASSTIFSSIFTELDKEQNKPAIYLLSQFNK